MLGVKKHPINQSNPKQGFTLVEISIVLIITGIAIAGILKGAEVLHNARVNASVAQIITIKEAFRNFEKFYGHIPGDMPNATTTLNNCGSQTFCRDGDGNGLIVAPNWTTDPYGPYIRFHGSFGGINRMESNQVWKHLALADMITDIDPSINVGMASQREFGKSHPSSSLRGGYEIYSDPITPGTRLSGHLIRFSPSLNMSQANWQHNLTAQEAFMIDTKIDDGAPAQGRAQVNIGNPINRCSVRVTVGQNVTRYPIENPARWCTLLIQID